MRTGNFDSRYYRCRVEFRGPQRGAHIGRRYLEAPGRLKAIAFDKTGTLTFGHPSVTHVVPVDGHSEEGLIANAAALEAHSTHPFARAVLQHADSRGISPAMAESFTVLPGEGAEGKIGGKTYWIGSHRMLEKWQRESPQFHDAINRLEEAGNSLVVMWCDDHVCGMVSIRDLVRPRPMTVSAFRNLRLDKVVMLTGDNRRTAN